MTFQNDFMNMFLKCFKNQVLTKFSSLTKNILFFKILKSRIFIFFILVFLLGFSFTYLVTNGDMNLHTNEAMGINYINTLDNLLKGRFDLDHSVVGIGETFIRAEKCYMYFGVFPALLRGVIEIFFQRGANDWSRLSTVLAAIIVTLFCTAAYYKAALKVNASQRVRYFYTLLFGLTIAFGSSATHLLSSAYIYHESIMWGLAWSSVFIWAYISILFSEKINLWLVFLASLSSGLALLSRVTFGSCAIALLFLVFVLIVRFFGGQFKNKPLLGFHNWPNLRISLIKSILILILAIMPWLTCAGFALKVNYERWGEPFNFCALKYYEGFIHNPQRLKNLEKSGIFNYLRFPYAFAFYFVPSLSDHFTEDFPYVQISGGHTLFDKLRNSKFTKLKEIHFDGIEPGNPITIHSPYLTLLALIGFFLIFKNYGMLFIVLAFSYFIQAVYALGLMGVSLRYSVEFMPLLIVCSIPSFKILASLDNEGGIRRLAVRIFALILTLLGIYLSLTTTVQQKLFLWSVPPEAKHKLTLIINNIKYSNGIINPPFLKSDKSLEIIQSGSPPANPAKGQIWFKDNDKTVLWFNGMYWNLIKDDHKINIPISFKIKVRFNKHLEGRSEPLLVTGRAGRADFVYLKYLPKNQVLFGHDHWGGGGLISAPISLDSNHLYLLEIKMSTLEDPNLVIKLDGQEVLNNYVHCYPTAEYEITVGRNKVGGTSCAQQFSGEIKEVERIGVN